MNGDIPVSREPADVTLEGAAFLPDEYIADAAQKLHLYRRLSRLERAADVGPLLDELRDRYGPPPPEVERLLSAARLRLAGTALGVDRIVIQGDAARVTFAAGASPLMTDLQKAFRDQQVEVEVRRPAPLSIVFRRAGAVPVDAMLATGLERLAGTDAATPV
jgi:transcription-repair coupling factor (superfamily II helicase)